MRQLVIVNHQAVSKMAFPKAFVARLATFTFLLALSVAALARYIELLEFYKNSSIVPAPIHVSAPHISDVKDGFFRSGPSFYSFYLANDTLAAIEEKKLAFFDHAFSATDRTNGIQRRLIYARWRTTPTEEHFPPSYTNSGDCLSCAFDPHQKEQINHALRTAGSYYTTVKVEGEENENIIIAVLPDMKIVIVSDGRDSSY